MQKTDYVETWNRLKAEFMRLSEKRATLEAELSDIRDEISRLDEVLTQLAPLADQMWWIAYEDDYSKMGLTESIRHLLNRNRDQKFSAREVEKALSERGYNMSALSVPMSSIYKILSRLEEGGEVVREKDGFNVFFKWNPPEITDEDIPF